MSGAVDFVEDPFIHIVSITLDIAEKIRFLYSDQSGMYGSKDGVNWKAAPSSVAAYGMAYGDGVWLAIGVATEESTTGWRSEDYGKTWEAIALPAFVSHIAFIKPKSDNVERPGVFAVSSRSWAGGTGIVSISTDQGKSWRQTLVIAESDRTDCLQAAGNRLYIPTDHQPMEDWNFEGWVYSSDDGESWAFTGVFTGATDDASEGPQYDFHAYGVGYDPLSKTYFCTGLETDYMSGGGPPAPITDKIIYATSADGITFAGKDVIRQATDPPAEGGSRLVPFESAAGGMGTFAMSAAVLEFGDVGDVSGGIEGLFRDAHQLVLEHGPVAGASWAGQCCFSASPGKNDQGTFAFVAFNSAGHGGVYVSNGGDWSLGKSGAPLTGRGFPRGALATGSLPWLDVEPAP